MMTSGFLFAAGGLHIADYVVIVVYFLAMIAIGIYFSGKQSSGVEYFIAGRSMPWLAVGLSLFSALLSTISYLAVPGETIHQGLAYSLNLLHIPLSYGVIYFVLIPFFMRLRVVSAYEYLERRFSPGVRTFGAALFMFYCFGWMAAVVLTCSQGLAHMTGWPLWIILLCNGLVSTVYTTIGGIRAVIWTDVAQAILMLAGGILTLVFVGLTTDTTPVDWWHNAARIGHTKFYWFSLDPSQRNVVFWIAANSFAWMVCTHGGNQVALQRYFTMSSPHEARGMLLIKMAAEITMSLLLVATGFALLTYYHRLPELLPDNLSLTSKQDADKIFPEFIAHRLPPALAGGVVAALFAAAMSTISSGVNSMAAVFATDLYRKPNHQEASDPEQVQMGIWFTACSGTIITVVAWALANLPGDFNFIDLMQKAFNFMIGPLGVLFLIGMFLPRCRSRSAVVATLIGIAVGLTLAYWQQLFGSPVSPYWVIPCSATAALATGAILSMFEPARDPTQHVPTWRRVVVGDAVGSVKTADTAITGASTLHE
jgi:solute:Na+ symporter, SSS family